MTSPSNFAAHSALNTVSLHLPEMERHKDPVDLALMASLKNFLIPMRYLLSQGNPARPQLYLAPTRSTLVNTDQNRLGERIFARLACDVGARRVHPHRQTVGRQGEQPEMIVMQSMPARRTRPPVPDALEIIDGLHETMVIGVLRGALRQLRLIGCDVVSGPMMPDACRSIRIVAKQNKAAYASRRIVPAQRRREIFAIASESAWNAVPLGKGG